MDKVKFLVPEELTLSQFANILRNRKYICLTNKNFNLVVLKYLRFLCAIRKDDQIQNRFQCDFNSILTIFLLILL